MQDFTFFLPTRVVFGCGKVRQVGQECRMLGGKKAFVITGTTATATSPGFAAALESMREADLPFEVYDRIEHDPTLEAIETARQTALKSGADLIVAYGGGSPMDAGKAVAVFATNKGAVEDYLYAKKVFKLPGLPFLAIPTTAGSGSEVTAAMVIRDDERKQKTGLSHPLAFAKTAVIDPETHVSMPPTVTAATGMDALTHAIEAYTSKSHQPFSDAFCLQAIRLIGENLRRATGNGTDLAARSGMAAASTLAGVGFTFAGLGSVHGLAHAIGARFDVPHGVANALMLPYVMEASIIADMPRFRDIAAALGENISGLSLRDAAFAAVDAVNILKADLDIPRCLTDVGVRDRALKDITEDALAYRLRPLAPRDFCRADFQRILNRAMGKP
ncbi:MAG: iron-containing alcohol dehydrogenase [Syntrophales bacterium]|nr:iron-containing alcohol dehydrogenase [Syntrophales bacterium]